MRHSEKGPGIRGVAGRRQILKLDFDLLQKYPIISMYVVPCGNSFEDDPLSCWRCIYFVKQGVYQGAILKFELSFPPNYPLARPVVRFLTPSHIYHPLICPKTGLVNLDIDDEWLPGKSWAVNVLLTVKKLIHLEHYYSLSKLSQPVE
mmetsp:Transcript_17679/g.29879  ORF Transcript_17679/g.29879 Transcript_17679/m.29879 type:complete len:148 (+) Transcript_17679:158-601(+)